MQHSPINCLNQRSSYLLVFWGAAIVIFLAKIINFHNANTQGFWIEVSSQVETGIFHATYLSEIVPHCILKGLFTLTSIGLIPSRALDTYSQSASVFPLNLKISIMARNI
jgi:hypothetical protein